MIHDSGVKSKSCEHSIPIKEINFVNDIPRVRWTEEEVDRMNVIEELQFAVVGKLSYGWSGLDDLRIQLPKQLNIKGDCKISLLQNWLILMKFDQWRILLMYYPIMCTTLIQMMGILIN